MEDNKEIIEDITAEVIASGADGLVSADALLKSDSKAHKTAGNDAARAAAYKRAAPREKRAEVGAGEIASKLIGINRITKVTKGGRALRFNALVVVGDRAGRVAVGGGKAKEVTEAIRKAEADAKKQFKTVPMRGTTIPHEVIGRFGTSKVKMIPAKEGSGLVAGISVRAVLDLAGYKDVTAKCYGSTNSTNVVKAAMDALVQLRTAEEIFALRGKTK